MSRMPIATREDRMDIGTSNITGALGQYEAGQGRRLTEEVAPTTETRFAETLNTQKTANMPMESDHERLAQQGAKGLVTHALILPMLKQIRREASANNPVFNGGIGENTFGPEFDIQIADRMVQSPKMKNLTGNLANRLLKRSAAASSVKTKVSDPTTSVQGVDVHG